MAHWKSLPADVKEHEVKRMHCFLFKTTGYGKDKDDSSDEEDASGDFDFGASETLLPRPFFPEVKSKKADLSDILPTIC